jgi:hypothetical protein
MLQSFLFGDSSVIMEEIYVNQDMIDGFLYFHGGVMDNPRTSFLNDYKDGSLVGNCSFDIHIFWIYYVYKNLIEVEYEAHKYCD